MPTVKEIYEPLLSELEQVGVIFKEKELIWFNKSFFRHVLCFISNIITFVNLET
jgi:hypothetical protein